MDKELSISLSYTFLTNAEIKDLGENGNFNVKWSTPLSNNVVSNIVQGNYGEDYVINVENNKCICVAIFEKSSGKIQIYKFVLCNLNGEVILEGNAKLMSTMIIKAQRKELISPRMVTIKEAAEFTGLSSYYVRQLVLKDKIIYVKTGKKFLVNLEKLIEFLRYGDIR